MLPEPFHRCLVLTGPTGSGKSALALELAERLNAEIVAMDSMTLYRGMDVGTAKPTPAERAAIPHHLIDVLEPHESASVAWWLEQAAAAVRDIEARGKHALLVGGTPLYLKALFDGLFAGPPADPQVRAELEQEAESAGSGALHARLHAVDPVTAARLHPNDVRRVVRALEVWRLTGQPLSQWQTQWRRPTAEAEADSFPVCLRLEVPRAELYDRINRRVEAMIQSGWLDEVQNLLKLTPPPSRQAWQALGYPEIAAVVRGELSLADAISTIQTKSRQFAKRQLTWFRQLSMVRPVDAKLTFAIWALRMRETS